MAREPANPDQKPLDSDWEAADDVDSLQEISPADVLRYIRGVRYPAGRDDLLLQAQKLQAPDDVMSVIHSLSDRKYRGVSDVREQLAGHD